MLMFQLEKMVPHFCFRLALVLGLALPLAGRPAEYSALWGRNGEAWTPQSRLPDFSWAGYHCGERALPTLPPGVSVKSFGAKGDGVTDDSEAFLKALATVESGAIEVPPGRYRLTKILEIRRPGIVLRGAGPDKSVLFFPVPLNEIRPNWGATTTGQRTSNYSWSGGFVWVRGDLGIHKIAAITAPARRGDQLLGISSAEELKVGQRIVVLQTDNADNSLAKELYSGDLGSTAKLHGSSRMQQVCRITRLAATEVSLDRPLRFDVKPEWKPHIASFAPTVTEAGVENLGFEFPDTPYQGHFTELGYNAVAMQNCSDCWARNLRIVNADSGIYAAGFFCTVQDVVFESARTPDRSGSTGHHGIGLGHDCLFTRFDLRTQFIHDITVDGGASGNVAAGGKGVDLCFDGHKRACAENLFTDIDAGAGTHLWRHGGGADLGKAFAARCTWWNIRTSRPQSYPPTDFGPPSMNFVAVTTGQPSATNLLGRWFEAAQAIQPPDLHAAQLARRLERR
jgi:hypothetical protein